MSARVVNQPVRDDRDPLALACKAYRDGTDRVRDPETTLGWLRESDALRRTGITRAANITGLDRVGIPVVSVVRPNSRSLSVSQGKGTTLAAAHVSALMEAIESWHAEHAELPLVYGSYAELRRRERVVDPARLPRTASSRYRADLPLLWTWSTNLVNREKVLLPYELVHLDLRKPLPSGSGSFLISSNGLSSGNHLLEAINHAICELVERDANTLWHSGSLTTREQRAVDCNSIAEGSCNEVLRKMDEARLMVRIWETTSDVGVASFLATVCDADDEWHAMPPISGSGCHPRREVALLRALTEAAQGRLTVISGARDDLGKVFFDGADARTRAERFRNGARAARAERPFLSAPDADHHSFDEDVTWLLAQLQQIGLNEVLVINLTHRALDIPVVRVVIPGLEAMSEVPGYLPGARAHAVQGTEP